MPLDLSVQLYTLRDALTADFDGTLAALAELGYTQVEPFALVDFAEQLRSGLGAHHLTAPTTHVSLLKGDQEAIFALAVELGISTVIDPFVDPERSGRVSRTSCRWRVNLMRQARRAPAVAYGSATTTTGGNSNRG